MDAPTADNAFSLSRDVASAPAQIDNRDGRGRRDGGLARLNE